jgi:dihydrofolate reductase
MDALLYGRRMYETMAVWQTMDSDLSLPDYILEFAHIWKTKPKVIFSTTLKDVGDNCRLAQGSIAEEVATLKRELEGDFSVSGPGIASEMARLRLIDEYRMVIYPIIVGGGKSYLPKLESPVRLKLLESRIFMCGATYLRYQAL